MTTLDDWRALQRDVDAATGPNERIDADIWRLVPDMSFALPVTASLDAVLALIEREMPGQAGTILFECLRVPRTKLIDRGQPMFKWLVLDVLSAFIRARIAELEQERAA